jgi:hypothetical protein
LDSLDPYGSAGIISLGNAKTHQRSLREALESCRTPSIQTFLTWLAAGKDEKMAIPNAASLLKTRVLYEYEGIAELGSSAAVSTELNAAIEKIVEDKLTATFNGYGGQPSELNTVLDKIVGDKLVATFNQYGWYGGYHQNQYQPQPPFQEAV